VPASASAPAPLQAIPPPPPPADAPPPTIAVGQTKEQVTAAFGQPMRLAKIGTKEIYYYKDMKVTFLNGKVSNVE
jgi:outer membrane protein assembly factor BamE (lipoprotein component of BamABCDE complex)